MFDKRAYDPAGWLFAACFIGYLIIFVISFLLGRPTILLVYSLLFAWVHLVLVEKHLQPIRRFADWLYFRKIAKHRRAKYSLLRGDVKGGTVEDFEREARKVIR